jgi:hypothetical protein
MSFTFASLLWALPVALVPLLLHLLSKRQARRLPLSDLRLLREVNLKALPRALLRQRLLVAARCGLLALLLLSWAGPVLSGRSGDDAAAAEEGLDIALLLDVSWSMGAVEGGRRRLDAAKAAAAELLKSLRPSDRAAVLTFSDRVEGEAPVWGSSRRASELLARASLTWRVTDLAPALRAAYALPAEPGRRRVVLVLSDGAAHSLRSPLPAAPAGVALYGLAWADPPPNSSVLSAGPASDSAAGKPRLRARLRLEGRGSLDLRLGSSKLQTLAVAGDEAVLPLPEKGPWAGRVALRPDALPADDEAYFSFSHPPRRRLLVVYGDSDFFRPPHAGYFLRELPLEAQVEWLELGRLKEARLDDYAGLVLAEFRDVPAWAGVLLERYVRQGGALLVLPAARPEIGTASIDSFLPAKMGPSFAPPRAFGIRADWLKGFELGKVAVGRLYALQPRPGSEVTARAAGGEPLLVTGRHGAGRAAIWAGSLDTGWSNLALKPLFAAWLPGALDQLWPAAERTERLEARVGEPLRRVWSADEPAPSRLRLRSPDGRSTLLSAAERRISWPDTDRPGLYVMTEEGPAARVFVWAVNADRSTGEGDLTPAEDPPWVALDADALVRDFWLEAGGRDARPAALLAAAGLLALEMALSLPRAAALLLLLLGLAAPASAFTWTQLKLGPTWDPYPGVSSEIVEHLTTVTSALAEKEGRVITLKDPELFFSPLVVLAGREAPPPLDEEERRRLRQFITGGGMIWIEDVSGASSSSFDRWVRRTLAESVPESELTVVPAEHALFKSFYLVRGAAGRVLVRGTLEGLPWAGRMAVVYSRNDMLGAWAKDNLGRALMACVPGGEGQRHQARKLTLNVVMYSLTGNYKSDAVHQPYLLQKLRAPQ